MKHIPRKRFGQNFLKDASVLDAIVNAVNPAETDKLVEIGPGMGALTERLLARIPEMDAIEIDRDLAASLEKRFPPEKLRIHCEDALRFNFASLAPAGGKLRVTGNLPYNISTPLLFHLMDFAPMVEDQHFMLQKEVVERMAAEPGTKAFGRLSVMLQWRYHIELLFTVPPEAFDPAPKVDSAVVRMIPKDSPAPCSPDALEKTVTQAFSQRRKMLRNTLSPLFKAEELESLGIDPVKRPEDLSVGDFVLLANHLK